MRVTGSRVGDFVEIELDGDEWRLLTAHKATYEAGSEWFSAPPFMLSALDALRLIHCHRNAEFSNRLIRIHQSRTVLW